MSFLKGLIGGRRGMRMARYERRVADVGKLEPELRVLSDGALRDRAVGLRQQAQQGVPLHRLLVELFAMGREAARRTLGMRHFDVQLVGGMALHEGLITEMKTGEGKTLVATLPAALNALTGRGVHIVTVNDYLAQRDAEWMGPLYELLGLTVGVIVEQMGDDPEQEIRNRRAAYRCDITYGTNHEIAFDYLRDNLAAVPEEIAHREFHYAIIDEVDFLIIDEARTPLIISGPAREDPGLFRRVNKVTQRLKEGYDFVVEPKTRRVSLTDQGLETVQRQLGVENLTDPDHLDLFHAVYKSVEAHGAYHRDVDYIVDGGRVYIVDEFTGRVSEDKRYADGLHQAIEAKEGVRVRAEDRTLAKVTYQTFYGRYEKLSGMTGTAWSERDEFMKTYGRDVQVVPTNQPMVREDYEDVIFDSLREKHEAVAAEIGEAHEAGRPVLVGSTSVRESEQLAKLLAKQRIRHAVLNAKNHRAEAAVIAQAGRKGAVTISTNMAGRGTDIILGGNAKMLAQQQQASGDALAALERQCAAEREDVVQAGGLLVIGTSHHDSVRIDDQLRGRAGRQGDPGASIFLVCLDDEIYRKFGKGQLEDMRAELRENGHPHGEPVESPRVRRALTALQKKVEVENQAIRRDVLKYDLVVHHQRETIYGWRRTLVTGEGFEPEELVRDVVQELAQIHDEPNQLAEALRAHLYHRFEFRDEELRDMGWAAEKQALDLLHRREERFGREILHEVGRRILLDAIDDLWTEHLSALERVEEGIGLRGYAQVDPVIEWRREATEMWHELLSLIRARTVSLWFAVDIEPA
jgi:preprotein translocase subunit SecA